MHFAIDSFSLITAFATVPFGSAMRQFVPSGEMSSANWHVCWTFARVSLYFWNAFPTCIWHFWLRTGGAGGGVP